MEKDYIKIYEKVYQQEFLNQEQFIKDELNNFDFDENINDNLNAINTYQINQYNESVVLKNPYDKLLSFFKNKSMAKGKKLKIIPKYLLPMYNNLEKSSLKLSFIEFVEQLAMYNARDEANRVFGRLRSLLTLMHKVQDFSEFELNEKLAGEYTEIYEKYRLLVHKPESIEKDKLVDSKESNSIEENIFNLTPSSIKIFKNRDFYNALIEEEYIDGELTNFDNFQDVFFVKHEKHNSVIHFFCDKYIDSYFLWYLAKIKKGQLSQSDVANSKRFKRFDKKIITQSDITRSKNYLEPRQISQIENFVDSYLK